MKLTTQYQLAHAISLESLIEKAVKPIELDVNIEKLTKKEIKELIHLLKQIIK